MCIFGSFQNKHLQIAEITYNLTYEYTYNQVFVITYLNNIIAIVVFGLVSLFTYLNHISVWMLQKF